MDCQSKRDKILILAGFGTYSGRQAGSIWEYKYGDHMATTTYRAKLDGVALLVSDPPI